MLKRNSTTRRWQTSSDTIAGMPGDRSTPESFFDGSPDGLRVFRAIAQAVDEIAEAQLRISKSQIAFRRQRGFAYVWRPAQYIDSDIPAVLSIALGEQLHSPRFKEVVHPSAKVWMHHLELREPAQVDNEVKDWLRQAYDSAG